MNRPLLIFFLCIALFGIMALMPDGLQKKREVLAFQSQERFPSSLPHHHDALLVLAPAAGEPSDNGLTQNLHREFRETLNRDPISAIQLAKEFIFTDELDPNFRLEILRELKAIQFSQPGVIELAEEVVENSTNIEIFEEALTIKFASMNDEDFERYVAEVSSRHEEPQYQAILHNYEIQHKL